MLSLLFLFSLHPLRGAKMIMLKELRTEVLFAC